MSVQQRRERERAQRHQLIIATARELAETEGWEAVTTRRLADRVEYSQPVLYSHFKGKDAIVRAVALEGFGELATSLGEARMGKAATDALHAVAVAYLGFAAEKPALYDAMFVLSTDLPFGEDGVPRQLSDAFGEIQAVVEPLAGGQDSETLTEVFWSALHGLASLTRNGRLRDGHHQARLNLLVERFLTADAPRGIPRR